MLRDLLCDVGVLQGEPLENGAGHSMDVKQGEHIHILDISSAVNLIKLSLGLLG